MSELPSVEDLKKRPLRAIVAYAARCVRRVQPLYRGEQWQVDDVARAIGIAEDFCLGPVDEKFVADAANDAYVVSGFMAADTNTDVADATGKAANAGAYANAVSTNDNSAVHSAAAAADYARPAARYVARAANAAAALADYERLLALELGEYPELGLPVDPTESGPLGSLWPHGPPSSFRAVQS